MKTFFNKYDDRPLPKRRYSYGCKLKSIRGEACSDFSILLCEFLQFLSKLTLSLLLNQRLILNLRKIDELNILEN
ncbi:hypothetical protein DDW12_04220 [Sulfolobus islandicus]|nr:hypothetical protein DDW12_04220 [Sulfolobus islandicus]